MYSSSENNLFTSEDDLKIEKLGIFFRKFRIDELPQFINILLGQISKYLQKQNKKFISLKF